MQRRDFLRNSTAMTVLFAAGCGQDEPIPTHGLPDNAIDIHAHIFNASDVPLRGFLTQVVLRENDEPARNSPYDGLINLVVSIMFSRTKSAGLERDEIIQSNAKVYSRTEAELLAQDEKKLAAGIADFENQVLSNKNAVRKAVDTEYNSNKQMLTQLYGIIGSDFTRISREKSHVSAAASIAKQIYRPQSPLLKRIGGRNTSLFQLLRWASTMARDRRGVLTQLKSLYGKKDEIEIFSPSIVDFEYWLIKDEEFSPVQDQIEVMSEIAKWESDVVLLNFVSFCPLRAAVEQDKGNDPLGLVKMAVSSKRGFAGVKLYPPMGFLPIGNDPGEIFGKKPNKMATGKAINHQLDRLYRWCIKNDVPIKAHGNNSLGADTNGGCNASPVHWGRVLNDRKYAGLRVNIAHFGGFDETLPKTMICPDSHTNGQDWETVSAKLTDSLSGLYVDLGYWQPVLQNSGETYHRVINKTGDLLMAHPNLENKIMYGSDYSMIGQLTKHNNYLADVKNAILDIEAKTNKVLMKNFMSGNAVRYLGLDKKGLQWKRLSDFFGREHKFSKIFEKLPHSR